MKEIYTQESSNSKNYSETRLHETNKSLHTEQLTARFYIWKLNELYKDSILRASDEGEYILTDYPMYFDEHLDDSDHREFERLKVESRKLLEKLDFDGTFFFIEDCVFLRGELQ